MKTAYSWGGAAFIAALVWSGQVNAQEEAASELQVVATSESAPTPGFYESSAGIKGLFGAALWSAPDDVPAGYDGPGFVGDAAGFAWGVAAYYEGRIAQYFGFELDVGYDKAAWHRTVTFNSVVDLKEEVSASGLRAGLLLKGILPTSFGRLWLGVGVDHVSGSTAEGSMEITDGEEFVQNREEIENSTSAVSKSSTLAMMGLGLVFHVGDLIEIPVDLRAGKNLSQDAAWDERVDFAGTPVLRSEVTAQSSWDYRLGLGLGVRF